MLSTCAPEPQVANASPNLVVGCVRGCWVIVRASRLPPSGCWLVGWAVQRTSHSTSPTILLQQLGVSLRWTMTRQPRMPPSSGCWAKRSQLAAGGRGARLDNTVCVPASAGQARQIREDPTGSLEIKLPPSTRSPIKLQGPGFVDWRAGLRIGYIPSISTMGGFIL